MPFSQPSIYEIYIWFILAKKLFADEVLLNDLVSEDEEKRMMEKCFSALNQTLANRIEPFSECDNLHKLLGNQDLFPDIWNFSPCRLNERIKFVFSLWEQVQTIKLFRARSGKEDILYQSEYASRFRMMKILAQKREPRTELVELLNDIIEAKMCQLTADDVCDALYEKELMLWMGWPRIKKERLLFIFDLYSTLNKRIPKESNQARKTNCVKKATIIDTGIDRIPPEIQAEISYRAGPGVWARGASKMEIAQWVVKNCKET